MKRTVAQRLDTGAAVLWASAFVLIALIITQASTIGGATAHAGSALAVNDLVVLTAQSTSADEVLVVLDQREEQLFVYGVENRGLRLYDVQDVADLFSQAGRGGGSR